MLDGGYAPTLKVARIASHIEAALRDNKFIRYYLLGRIDMRELESVSSRSVVPPPQGFWGDVIGGYAAGALTNVAAGHLAAGMADAEYAAVAIADDLAFGGIIGALGAALKETPKERAFYLEGPVDRQARSSP
jgi:hypothetical protein